MGLSDLVFIIDSKNVCQFSFVNFFFLTYLKEKVWSGHNVRSVKNSGLRYYPPGKCQNAYLREIASKTVTLDVTPHYF